MRASRKGVSLSVSLDCELVELIDARARDLNQTRSQYLSALAVADLHDPETLKLYSMDELIKREKARAIVEAVKAKKQAPTSEPALPNNV